MKLWLKILLGTLAVGIISLLLVYKFVYNKPHPDFDAEQPAFTLNAKDLYDEYRNAPDASAAKYNGQMVEITGTLSRVEAPDSLDVAVFVFNKGDFGDEGIRCTMLPRHNAQAKKLQPDGEIRIKGFCTGYNDPDVVLEKCSIISQ